MSYNNEQQPRELPLSPPLHSPAILEAFPEVEFMTTAERRAFAPQLLGSAALAKELIDPSFMPEIGDELPSRGRQFGLVIVDATHIEGRQRFSLTQREVHMLNLLFLHRGKVLDYDTIAHYDHDVMVARKEHPGENYYRTLMHPHLALERLHRKIGFTSFRRDSMAGKIQLLSGIEVEDSRPALPPMVPYFGAGSQNERVNLIASLVQRFSTDPHVAAQIGSLEVTHTGLQTTDQERIRPTRQEVVTIYRDIEHALHIYTDDTVSQETKDLHGKQLVIAVHRLFFSYMGLVRAAVVTQQKHTELNFEEMMQEGSAGLMRGVSCFNYTQGPEKLRSALYTFTTRAVMDAMAAERRKILTDSGYRQFRHIREVTQTFQRMNGGDMPSNEELMERTGYSAKTLRFVLNRMDRHKTYNVSLQSEIPGTYHLTYEENFEDEDAQTAFTRFENRETLEAILREADLSDYQQAVLSLCYGVHMRHLRGKIISSRRAKINYDEAFTIAGTTGLTNSEVEQIFGLKTTSLRYIKRLAMRKIRTIVEEGEAET